MTCHELNDCFRDAEGRLYLADALAILRQKTPVISKVEETVLSDAGGRVLARDLISPRNVPGHNNAAMDGFAFRHADLAGYGCELPVMARQAAGDPPPAPLKPGTAVRIFTGAIMPDGADTVAMEEDCRILDNGACVVLPEGLKPGANHRFAGEDIKRGEVILPLGRHLRAAEIGLAAAMGFAKVPVFSKLRVAVLSCGNELKPPGVELAAGGVYDSNRFMLLQILRQSGFCDVTDLGILPDDRKVVDETIGAASATHDVILTSAGASKSEADHIVRSVADKGRLHVWQVAIKPGRPLAFGVIQVEKKRECLFVGLPGNPVAAFICMVRITMPLLRQLAGGGWQEPRKYPVRSGFSMKKKPSRREFLRVSVQQGADGALVAEKFPHGGSGILTSVAQSDGLVELAEDLVEIAPGDWLEFMPFDGMGL